MIVVDLELGADVDAARRLVEDEDRRLGHQPLGEHDLLLVAAGEAWPRAEGVVTLMLRCHGSRTAVASAPRLTSSTTSRAKVGQRDERDVVGDGRLHHEALLAPVLGDEGHAARGCFARGESSRRAVPSMTISPSSKVEAEQDPRELGPARAHQPEDAEDLALAGWRSTRWRCRPESCRTSRARSSGRDCRGG